MFDQVFGHVSGQGVWTRKYNVQFYRDEENHNKTSDKYNNDYYSAYMIDPNNVVTYVCFNIILTV